MGIYQMYIQLKQVTQSFFLPQPGDGVKNRRRRVSLDSVGQLCSPAQARGALLCFPYHAGR